MHAANTVTYNMANEDESFKPKEETVHLQRQHLLQPVVPQEADCSKLC